MRYCLAPTSRSVHAFSDWNTVLLSVAAFLHIIRNQFIFRHIAFNIFRPLHFSFPITLKHISETLSTHTHHSHGSTGRIARLQPLKPSPKNRVSSTSSPFRSPVHFDCLLPTTSITVGLRRNLSLDHYGVALGPAERLADCRIIPLVTFFIIFSSRFSLHLGPNELVSRLTEFVRQHSQPAALSIMAAPQSPGPASPRRPSAALAHANSFSHRPLSPLVPSEQRHSTGSFILPHMTDILDMSPTLDAGSFATKPLPGLPLVSDVIPACVPLSPLDGSALDFGSSLFKNQGAPTQKDAISMKHHKLSLPFPSEVTREQSPAIPPQPISPSSPSFLVSHRRIQSASTPLPPCSPLETKSQSPAIPPPLPLGGAPITNWTLKSKRSAASLRSIPERRSEDSDRAPPVPRPPSWVEGQTRHPSEDGNASGDSSQDSFNRSNLSGARSTRHSHGSQYAASASTSAWTPSSFGGSRLGLDTGGIRTSLASRDSRLTSDSDVDEDFSKNGPQYSNATIKRSESASWRQSSAASLFAVDHADTKLPTTTEVEAIALSSSQEPFDATLAALIDAEWGAKDNADSMIGLGITSDEAVDCTRGSRSPSLSGAAGAWSRPSRSASLSGALNNAFIAAGYDVKSQSPGSPVINGRGAIHLRDISRSQPSRASTSSQGSPSTSVLPLVGVGASLPRSPSAPTTIHSGNLSSLRLSMKNPGERELPVLAELNTRSTRNSDTRSQAASTADDPRTSKSTSVDWDDGCDSPFVAFQNSINRSTSRGVLLAEDGRGTIVDWKSSNQDLELLNIPEGTTHLLLANTQLPLIVGPTLHMQLPAIAGTLVVLDISYANMTSLPTVLGTCTSLEELNLSGNPLSQGDLPSWLGNLTSLRMLAADACNISYLPSTLASLTSLRDLSLRENRLRALPSWMCHLSELDVLLVDQNTFDQPWADLVEPLLAKRTVHQSAPSPPPFLEYPSSIVDPTMSAPLQFSEAWTSSFIDDPRPHTAAPSVTVFPSSSTVTMEPQLDDLVAPLAEQTFKPSMRRMRSAGELRTEALVTPPIPSPDPSITLASLMQAEVRQSESDMEGRSSPLVLAEQESSPDPGLDHKKSFGFLKKMSLGKLRSRPRTSSIGAMRRPSQVERLGSADTLPVMPRKQPKSLNLRARTQSYAIPVQAGQGTITKRLPHRRSFLNLDQMALQSSGTNSSNADHASSPTTSDQTSQFAPPSPKIDPRTGLRSIMMYLQDVHDLLSEPIKKSGMILKSNPVSPYVSRASSIRAGITPLCSPTPEGDANTNLVNPMANDVEQIAQHSDFSSANYGTEAPAVVDRSDRRRKVIEEIVGTEQSYSRGLQELQHIYIHSASSSIPGIGSGISGHREAVVPMAERKAVFTNVEAIIGFHVDVLLPDIKKATAAMTASPPEGDDSKFVTTIAEAVAKVFIRNSAFLKLYSSYITQFNTALDHLRDWTTTAPSNGPSAPASPTSGTATPPTVSRAVILTSSQKKRIRQWLKRCRSHSSHHQINLESYLLLPVQRLPRYRLLLESLAACTPGDAPGSSNAAVTEALHVISAITADMNERKRDSEGRQRLLYWQQRLGNRFKSPLVQPHRTLIKEGAVTLARTVRIQSEDEQSQLFNSPSLCTDRQTVPIVALLCTDLLVFCKDHGDGGKSQSNIPCQLIHSLRLPTQARQGGQLPASIFGADRTMIRYVDSRTIFYLHCSSRRVAVEWATAINAQVPL